MNFFPRVQILIFLCETTQGDHIRLLYEFEMCSKNFGCVGSCGYVTPSVKIEAQFCINVTLCLGQNFPEIKVAVLGNLRQILCKLFGIHLIGLGELRQ